MKEKLKQGFINLGGVRLLRYLNQTPRVLFWHGVDNVTNPTIEAENINIDSFRKQIVYLKKHFDIISLDEFYYRFLNNHFSKKEVVLTFDDGYKNNLTIVASILNENKLPFTVFVSTNHISTGDLFPTSLIRLIVFGSGIHKINIPALKLTKDLRKSEEKIEAAKMLTNEVKTLPNHFVKQVCAELIDNVSDEAFQELKYKYSSITPLNWKEVKNLTTVDCTIGSHCLDHFCCHKNQLLEETQRQIFESKIIIEENTRKPCHYFAYPNGNFTDESNAFVNNAGYRLGFTTQKQKIRRTTINQAVPRISMPGKYNTFQILVNLYPK